MRVMVLHAHPVEESYNRSLCNAVLETLKANGHEADLVDLYAENFQPVLTREVEQALPVAETPIGLLQGNDVRIYLANDPEGALGIELSVDADAFVDVVGSHQHARLPHALHGRRLPGMLPAHSKPLEDL